MNKLWQLGSIIVGIVLLTAIVVFYIDKNAFEIRLNNLEDKIIQLEKENLSKETNTIQKEMIDKNDVVINEINTDASNKNNDCIYNLYADSFVDGKKQKLIVDIPCDWKYQDSSSNMIEIYSPDRKASFHWPVADMGMHDMTLVDEGNVTINNQEYPFFKYQDSKSWTEMIQIDNVKNDMGFGGVLLYSSDSSYDDVLQKMLSSIRY